MEKRFVVRFLVIASFLVFFIYYLFFSNSGLMKYFKIKNDISKDNAKIAKLETEIKNIDESISKFEKISFNVEKEARQDLQMGSQGETVYVLNKL